MIKSVFENCFPGGTCDPPVPSGDSPDGIGTVVRVYECSLFGKRLSAVSVGGSPTEAGESPAPPIFQTRSKPERFRQKWGARPSRSHQSASRRLDHREKSAHQMVALSGRRCFRPEAENRGRDARAPQLNCIVPAEREMEHGQDSPQIRFTCSTPRRRASTGIAGVNSKTLMWPGLT
jgi:hypothetical protein